MAAFDRFEDAMEGLEWDKLGANRSQSHAWNGSSPSKKKPNGRSDAMKLKREDMYLFGVCPAWDQFYLVVCEYCGQVIKPQALAQHIEIRHTPTSFPTTIETPPPSTRSEASSGSASSMTNNGTNCCTNSSLSNDLTLISFEPNQSTAKREASPQSVESPGLLSTSVPTPTGPEPGPGEATEGGLPEPEEDVGGDGEGEGEREEVMENEDSVLTVTVTPPTEAEMKPVIKPDKAKVTPTISKATPCTSSSTSNSVSVTNVSSSASSTCPVSKKPLSVTPYVREKLLPCKDREYDADKHCGVISTDNAEKPCTRSLTCKSHSLTLRRNVKGRSKNFDDLLSDHRANKEAAMRAAGLEVKPTKQQLKQREQEAKRLLLEQQKQKQQKAEEKVREKPSQELQVNKQLTQPQPRPGQEPLSLPSKSQQPSNSVKQQPILVPAKPLQPLPLPLLTPLQVSVTQSLPPVPQLYPQPQPLSLSLSQSQSQPQASPHHTEKQTMSQLQQLALKMRREKEVRDKGTNAGLLAVSIAKSVSPIKPQPVRGADGSLYSPLHPKPLAVCSYNSRQLPLSLTISSSSSLFRGTNKIGSALSSRLFSRKCDASYSAMRTVIGCNKRKERDRKPSSLPSPLLSSLLDSSPAANRSHPHPNQLKRVKVNSNLGLGLGLGQELTVTSAREPTPSDPYRFPDSLSLTLSAAGAPSLPCLPTLSPLPPPSLASSPTVAASAKAMTTTTSLLSPNYGLVKPKNSASKFRTGTASLLSPNYTHIKPKSSPSKFSLSCVK